MLGVIDPIPSLHEITFFFKETLLTFGFIGYWNCLEAVPLKDTEPHCVPTFRDPEHFGHQTKEGSKTAPTALLRENNGAEPEKIQFFY